MEPPLIGNETGTSWSTLPASRVRGNRWAWLSASIRFTRSVDEVVAAAVRYQVPDGFTGWNALSVLGSEQIVADDWVCTNATPVTDIHWWGRSGLGQTVAAYRPSAFRITFWDDVPAGVDEHSVIPATSCTNYLRQLQRRVCRLGLRSARCHRPAGSLF